MQLQLISKLCLIVIVGSLLTSSYAVPFSRGISQLLNTLNDGSLDKLSADEDKAPYSVAAVNERQKRAMDANHNYVQTVFTLRRTVWKKAQCDTVYNCAEVSPLHCASNAPAKFFCSQGDARENVLGCELDFEIFVEQEGRVLGVDFSFFKKTEVETEGVKYSTHLVYKTETENFFPIALRRIEASCNGWQTMRTEDGFSNYIHSGVNNVTVILAIFKRSPITRLYQPLTCDKIKQIFFIDNKTQGFPFSADRVNKREVGVETEIPSMNTANSSDKLSTETTPTLEEQTDVSTTMDNNDNKKDTNEEQNDNDKPKIETTVTTVTQTNSPVYTEKEDNTEPLQPTFTTELPTKISETTPTAAPVTSKDAQTTRDTQGNGSLPTDANNDKPTTQTTTREPIEATTVASREITYDAEDFIPITTVFVVGEHLPL